MRVAHIEAGRHLYGGAVQVCQLLVGLDRAGVENVLVCARGSALAAQPVAGTLVELPMRGELDVALLPRLVGALRATAPDLVHVHSRRGADLFGGAAAAWLRLPAVLTRRVDAPEPRWLARYKYAPYGAVIALSRAIENQLRDVGIPPARIERIASAVDAGRLVPDAAARTRLTSAFALPADSLVVGVVAQLIPRKGHALLLSILPELVRALPGLRVIFFGQGPLARRLRVEVGARGLAGNVVFAGFRTDLPELLPGLDVLVHPVVREGLGLALLEAASVGVPVVACAAGGVPDVVVHGRTGLLVPPEDRMALHAALVRLLLNPGERAAFGRAARAHVLQRHAIGDLVAAHVALYRRVLAERAAEGVGTVAR